MKKKFLFWMSLIVLLSVPILFAQGQQDVELSAESGEKIVLRLAHSYPVTNVWHKGAELAAKLVEERTSGQVEIKIFSDSQLGTEEQITEQVIYGSIDIGVSGAGQIGNLFKPINITEMPFTFKDNNHVLRFAKSDIAKQMFNDLESELNLKVLGCSSYGIRQIISKKPVKTPDDIRGIKFRVPEQNIWIEVVKSMNAIPTPIAYSETYLGLQQGVVEALDNPMSGINSMKFYEVGKYISKTSHVAVVCFFLMNGDMFQSLSETNQEIILGAFEEASEYIVELLNKEDQDLGEFFKKQGVTIIEPDVQAFRDVTSGMPEKYKNLWSRYGEDLHSKIQEM